MPTKVIEFQSTQQMNEWLTRGQRKVVSLSSRRHLDKAVFWWAPLGALLLMVGQGAAEPRVAPVLQTIGVVLAVLGFFLFWSSIIRAAWRFVTRTSHSVVYEAEDEPSAVAAVASTREAK